MREQRPVWTCAALALGCWLAGSIYYTVSGQATQSTPSFSPADLLFMLSFPVAAASLCLLLRQRVRGFDATLLLDGLIASLAVAAVGATIIYPLLEGAGGDAGELSLKLSYLLGELILLTLIAWAIASTGWSPGRVLGWLSAALALALVASAIYLVELATGGYRAGNDPRPALAGRRADGRLRGLAARATAPSRWRWRAITGCSSRPRQPARRSR